MRHLSLFNGIGGFQLAAEWAGWENVAHVEIDEWCNKITAKHFPQSQCFTDIKQFDGTKFRNTIDIISGGFPCQPFSVAGKQRGTKDDRFLWPEMFRVIREIQPAFVVAENVPGIINQERGLVLRQIISDLENEGFEILPFLIPAIGVGAWHKRERLWIICHSNIKRELQQKRSIENIREWTSDNGKDVSDTYQFNGNLSRFYTSNLSQLKPSRIFKNIITDPECIGRKDGIYGQRQNKVGTSNEFRNYDSRFNGRD